MKNRTAYIHHKFYIYSIVVFTFLFVYNSSARINLPQISKALPISKVDQAHLWNIFNKPGNNSIKVIDEDVEEIILKYLKETYSTSCSEMISHWGLVAEGTATLNVRIIFINNNKEQATKQALLVIRCYSSYAEYGENYYDERLSVLLMDFQNASIILLPHAGDCTNCSELSRIRFEQIVQKKDPLIITLSIKSTSDNPCCGGPYQYNDEKINYYAFLESDVKQVASILRYQSEYSHDDIDGDYNRIYESRISNDFNQKERYASITSKYNIKTNGVEEEADLKYFVWNPVKEEFELSDK